MRGHGYSLSDEVVALLLHPCHLIGTHALGGQLYETLVVLTNTQIPGESKSTIKTTTPLSLCLYTDNDLSPNVDNCLYHDVVLKPNSLSAIAVIRC